MPDALSVAIVVTIINLGIIVFDIAQRAKIDKLIDDKKPTYSDWPDPSPERDEEVDDRTQERKNCPYCRFFVGEDWQELSGNWANLYRPANGHTYVVSHKSGEPYYSSKFRTNFGTPINYCPFCGRDLKGENDV